jgi:uncharacterized membrane protein
MPEALILKALHVLGAILLVGNGMVSALWKGLADRSGDPRVVARAQRSVAVADWVFTLPGALLLLVTGLARMGDLGGMGAQPWIRRGLEIYALVVLLWLAVLVPVQAKQGKLARDFAAGGAIPEAYRRLARIWNLVGGIMLLLLLAALAFMVLRPV